MQAKIVRTSVKVFGEKKVIIENIEKILDEHFDVVSQGLHYNDQHGNWEVWLNVFTEEEEAS